LINYIAVIEILANEPGYARAEEGACVSKSVSHLKRGGLIAGGVAIVSMVSLVLGGSAGAQTTTPANNIIIGSGSTTAYPLMVTLDDLFNQAPGCNLIAASGTQPLDFSCPSGNTGLSAPYGENPTNDVALEEPALGGKYGLSQLEDQGSASAKAAPIDFATGVRTPLATDPTGLNFVEYGRDAVSWFHWTEVNGTYTPSQKITSLSNAQLADIWNGTYTNWDQIKGGTNAPIDVYVTNSGSGLLSLWEQYLYNGTYNPQTYVESKGSVYASTHIIEQNEDASIIANGDEADAIFFFSNGRYHLTCKHVCGGTAVPGSGPTHVKLGEINDVPLTTANILSGAWPDPIHLMNIYSNGTNPNIPLASQATLNFISEQGFLCKPNIDPSTGDPTIDPNSGLSYHSEIDNLITAAGDVALPLGPEGTVDAPAVLSEPYSDNDSSGTDPQGYCKVMTTDAS
jgi:hypothetical protein